MELTVEIISDIVQKDNVERWDRFLERNESLFGDRACLKKEISHEQYAVYERFTNMIEDTVEKACSGRMPHEEFLLFIRDHQEEPAVDIFSNLMLLSSTFEAFCDMVSDRSKRQYVFSIIDAWRNQLSRSRK
jgi:hypothetical protein